ncbi:MAG: hypothetical protein AB9869_12375 [Verrucomicrobiia bacterium]
MDHYRAGAIVQHDRQTDLHQLSPLDNIGLRISFWLPLSGTGTGNFTAYDFRCNMVPLLNCIWDVRAKDADYELMRQLCQQFRLVADCYLGDYCPLTPYSLENTSWMGWQFDRPERGTGLVQVFRRRSAFINRLTCDSTAWTPKPAIGCGTWTQLNFLLSGGAEVVFRLH